MIFDNVTARHLLQLDFNGTCESCKTYHQKEVLGDSVAGSFAQLGSYHDFLVKNTNPQQQRDVTVVKYLTKTIANKGCLWVSLYTSVYIHPTLLSSMLCVNSRMELRDCITFGV